MAHLPIVLHPQDYQYWAVVGRPPDVCDLNARLGLHSKGGRKIIDHEYDGADNVMSVLWGMWLDISGIKDFADSRFTGISGPLRDLTCMLDLGLDDLLKPLFNDKNYHKHFLNGYKLLNRQSRLPRPIIEACSQSLLVSVRRECKQWVCNCD